MNKLYIVSDYYAPNTAATNRFLAFSKGFGELEIETIAIFLCPSNKMETISEKIKNVTFINLWNNDFYNSTYINALKSSFKLIKMLKKGDNIIFFGAYRFLPIFSFIRGLNIYHERTEHPEYNLQKASLINKIFIKIYMLRCKHIKGLFVISKTLKKHFINNGIDSSKVNIINMIVDSTRFENLQKTSAVENYIAYCGNLSSNKDGVDYLIKAFHLVEENISDLKLYIIGETPKKNDQLVLSELIDKFNLKDKIVFTGIVTADKMPQMLKDAKALVLARPKKLNVITGFGFPTKLGEYLLTSNPVIVTNVGDVELFLKDGESAWIAESENVRSIADRICWSVLETEKSLEIGQNGYLIALEHFNYLIEAQKIVNIVFDSYSIKK